LHLMCWQGSPCHAPWDRLFSWAPGFEVRASSRMETQSWSHRCRGTGGRSVLKAICFECEKSLQARVVDAWSPASGVILGSSGNPRKWVLVGEVGHTGCAFEGSTWSRSSLSLHPVHHGVRKLLYHTFCFPWCSAQAHGAMGWTLQIWAK
jgi:hypothetical protein